MMPAVQASRSMPCLNFSERQSGSPAATFSVVIALYNKAGYIANTLASVVAQTHRAAEIIVIDDGSTDGGANLVEALQLPGLRLIRQANGGVSKARNAGIAAAGADWVAFLDADDILHADYLATLAKLAADFQQAQIVATSYRSVPAQEALSPSAWERPALSADTRELIEDLPGRWVRGTCFFTSSVAVRRDLLERMQPCFPVGESVGEDVDLWFRLGERSPIALCARPLVLRVWVPDSLSAGHNPHAELPYMLRMEHRALSGQTPAALRGATLRYVDDTRVNLARACIVQGSRKRAWDLLSRSWRHASPHRWLLGCLMLLLPSRAVHSWQSWRVKRKMIL